MKDSLLAFVFGALQTLVEATFLIFALSAILKGQMWYAVSFMFLKISVEQIRNYNTLLNT